MSFDGEEMVATPYPKEFLPNHASFYKWISKKEQKRKLIAQRVYEKGLGKEIENWEVEYSNVAIDGVWDLRIDAVEGGQSSPRSILIEYKTSVDEMNVDQVIRQIKRRRLEPDSLADLPRKLFFRLSSNSEYQRYRDGEVVLASFDRRFEEYRSLFENEGIQLLIFSNGDRTSIKSLLGIRFNVPSISSHNPAEQYGELIEVREFAKTVR